MFSRYGRRFRHRFRRHRVCMYAPFIFDCAPFLDCVKAPLCRKRSKLGEPTARQQGTALSARGDTWSESIPVAVRDLIWPTDHGLTNGACRCCCCCWQADFGGWFPTERFIRGAVLAGDGSQCAAGYAMRLRWGGQEIH